MLKWKLRQPSTENAIKKIQKYKISSNVFLPVNVIFTSLINQIQINFASNMVDICFQNRLKEVFGFFNVS